MKPKTYESVSVTFSKQKDARTRYNSLKNIRINHGGRRVRSFYSSVQLRVLRGEDSSLDFHISHSFVEQFLLTFLASGLHKRLVFIGVAFEGDDVRYRIHQGAFKGFFRLKHQPLGIDGPSRFGRQPHA